MKILEILTEKRKTGNIGERAAAKFLKRNGYKILKRNYADSNNEIDIIAENKEYTVFVEVKTRTVGHQSPREPRPASAVNPEKQRRIISATRYYTSYERNHKKLRFDVIEVYLTDEKKKRVKVSVRAAEKEVTRGSRRRRQWHPTPALLPGKSHGQRSLVGRSPWGR